MTAFVAFDHVAKAFGSNHVYRDLDLEVMRGETLVLLGRSGSGKSVLLKLLLGLIRPDRGRILLEGQDLTRLDERALAGPRRRMGIVFQGGALFDSMTVSENVAYGLIEQRDWPPEKVAARVTECLAAVELEGVDRQLPEQLSGGMKKRVALARAIAPAPEILLYDEPTTGLDPATAHRIDDLIRSLQKKLGVTSMVVTHDMDCTYRVADRVAMIGDGRITWIGAPDAFRHKEEDLWTRVAASP